MAKVCILGGGSWGIGLSVVLHKNGHEVTVWSAVPAEIQMLQELSLIHISEPTRP